MQLLKKLQRKINKLFNNLSYLIWKLEVFNNPFTDRYDAQRRYLFRK